MAGDGHLLCRFPDIARHAHRSVRCGARQLTADVLSVLHLCHGPGVQLFSGLFVKTAIRNNEFHRHGAGRFYRLSDGANSIHFIGE